MRSLVFALLCVGNMAAAQITSGLGLVDPNQAEKEQEVFEDEARRIERYNEFIRNQNQKTQQAIDGLDAALRAAWERQRPKNNVQGNSSIQRQSGGITIIQEAPRQPNSQSEILRRRQVQKKIEAQRARQVQQRAEREERRKIEEERRREQERLRRAEEERRRQEQYNAVRATEYGREGPRTQRLSNEASWRTHEGADMLDRAHTADNLMRKEYANNFSNGHSMAGISPASGKHRIGSLRSRGRVAITGLDQDAIPWATMHKDALPWSEWGKNTETVPVLPPIPIKKPVDPTIDGVEQWRDLKERLGEEKLNPIIQLVAHETGNHFPDLLYYPEKKEYSMYDYNTNKLMSFSEDGERFTIHELKEKDDGLKEMWQNLKRTRAEAGFNALNMVESKVTVAPGESEGEKVKWEGKAMGIIGTSISDQKAGINIGDVNGSINYKGNSNEAEVKSEVQLGDVADMLKGEKAEYVESDKFELDIEGSLCAKVKIYENSSEIKHREFNLKSNGASLGYGYNIGRGLTVEGNGEISGSARMSGLGAKAGVGVNVSVAKVGGQGEIMYISKGKTYFFKAKSEFKVGYSYELQKFWGVEAQRDKEKKESEKSRKGGIISGEGNIGSLPLVLGMGLEYSYQDNEMALKSFNDKISGVRSGVGAGFGGGGGSGR